VADIEYQARSAFIQIFIRDCTIKLYNVAVLWSYNKNVNDKK
jgi:hypothetical protein